jgi:acetylornithine deacetylase/succinyl-diaminopimelate desuccinylase-like protein
MRLDEAFQWIDETGQAWLEELCEFLRIPSVSTDPGHAADMVRAADWLVRKFRAMGFGARRVDTEGHPVVLAEYTPLGRGPTLLVYGHYDVQPPDPLDEWVTPPFCPELREGAVYARGASDDKGQLFTHIKAAEACMRAGGGLPVNLKFLLEGEEEIGSPSLGPFLRRHAGSLTADAVAISDGSQLAAGTPAITYGLRGLSYVQVDVQGPRFDLHSGAFGGLVANPAQALCEILARLKGSDGTVAVPGFYDDVLPLDATEQEEMARLPLDQEDLKAYLGVKGLTGGEKGLLAMVRKTARPTLDVNGIWGGFAGAGTKTIIPARAGAKVSMRLVPNQDERRINALVSDFIRAACPEGVDVTVTDLHGAAPVLLDRGHPLMTSAARAIQTGFGKAPVFIREGGSIPVVNLFREILDASCILLMGWGRPDDGAHSPNERFHLEDCRRGIRSAAALLGELAR